MERLPILVIDPDAYRKVKELPFINHTFVWGEGAGRESGALGFGFASLCNHSSEPNAVINKNFKGNAIDLVALRDIDPDEEVTIRYRNTFFTVF